MEVLGEKDAQVQYWLVEQKEVVAAAEQDS